MDKLSFSQYKFKIKNLDDSSSLIFDELRKKYLKLTPEEWVRQHTVKFLLDLNYPASLIQLEKEIKLYSKTKRFDALVCNSQGAAHLLVECKAPSVKISQDTFDQISRYNVVLNAPFLFVTNGLKHYALKFENNTYSFISSLPTYSSQSNTISL